MCQDREKDSLDKFLEHPYYYGDVRAGDGIMPDKKDIPIFELTPDAGDLFNPITN